MKEYMKFFLICTMLTSTILSGCQTIPTDALKLSAESLDARQQQTRKFDGVTEQDALAAGAGVLQDMGFSITESETPLGVIVANKDRSATNAGQIAGAIVLTLLSGTAVPTDRNQKITASLVTRPVIGSNGQMIKDTFLVRVTFSRVVWNTQNQVTKAEQLVDEKMYQEFFDKFSKSVFLEGQKI